MVYVIDGLHKHNTLYFFLKFPRCPRFGKKGLYSITKQLLYMQLFQWDICHGRTGYIIIINIMQTNAKITFYLSEIQTSCYASLKLQVPVLILTSFLIPAYCLTILLALWNLATLAMVSAAKAFRSLTGESRIFTMLCRPPMSTMV